MLQNEEILLKIAEAQNGSNDAKEIILQNNLPLIKSIVRRYKNKQIDYEDLMSLGTLGLIKAINNFDATFGVKFSTYAVPMIAGEIKRFIRDDGAIKVSRSIKSTAYELNKFIESYRQKFSKEPTIEELATEFKMEATEVVFNLESCHYPLSIYQETEEDGLTLADKIVAKGTPDEALDKLILKELINKLDDRDKKIIILRYYRDKTQSEISKLLGISQVQVSRLENKILEKMKKELI